VSICFSCVGWVCVHIYIFPLQRDRKERKHYTDDWALGDEEIEGRRSFRLEDKMESDRFPQCFVKEMAGPGMLMFESIFVIYVICSPMTQQGLVRSSLYECLQTCLFQCKDCTFLRIAHLRRKCHNSKLVIFQEKCLKV
jgi:hypothetical protein